MQLHQRSSCRTPTCEPASAGTSLTSTADCVATTQGDGLEFKASDATTAAARTAATDVPHRVKSRRKGRRRIPLQEWNSLPNYLKDNEYIKRYYRVDFTFSQTLWSLFSIHNETGSVWTHLIGVVIFIVLTVVTIAASPTPVRLATEHLAGIESRFAGGYSELWQVGRNWETSLRGAGGQVEHQLRNARQQIEEVLTSAGRGGAASLLELEGRLRGYGDARLQDLLTWENWLLQHKGANLRGLETAISHRLASVVDLQWPSKRWPIHVFTAGAMTCLATSTVCHLFSNFGFKNIQKIWRYDYAGIVVLIVTSFVPVVYYSFLCNPLIRNFYLLTTVGLGVATCAVSLMSTFQSPKYRTFRAGLFAGLGLWGIVPGLHALILYGEAPQMQQAVLLDALMGATYLGGAALFAARIPERWRPGAFDLAGNSHQLFHCAVVVAALLHYWGVRILLEWRDTTGGCAVPFKDLIQSAAQNGTSP